MNERDLLSEQISGWTVIKVLIVVSVPKKTKRINTSQFPSERTDSLQVPLQLASPSEPPHSHLPRYRPITLFELSDLQRPSPPVLGPVLSCPIHHGGIRTVHLSHEVDEFQNTGTVPFDLFIEQSKFSIALVRRIMSDLLPVLPKEEKSIPLVPHYHDHPPVPSRTPTHPP